MCEKLLELREGMRRFATRFEAALASVADAEVVVEHASAIERMAAAVKAAAAARVADTEVWRKGGDRSAAHHLARKTGSSVGQAQSALETARRLRQLPEASDATRRGELSPAQSSAIADAATADPAAERRLLEKARRSSLSDLRDDCAATKAAADPDLEARRRRIHDQRSLRDWTDAEGVWHAHCRDNPEVGAAFRAALDPIRDEIFRMARAEGRREPLEAYAADALAEMARRADRVADEGDGSYQGSRSDGTGAGDGPDRDGESSGDANAAEPGSDAGESEGSREASGVRKGEVLPGGGGGAVARAPRAVRVRGGAAKILVRVDLEALLRGYPCDGETCEIAGFGPVAVSAVREMIDSGDPFLAAVATRGVEVLGVAHLGRRPTAAQQTALQWLYPRCANEACGGLARLEYDHRRDWAATHVTLFEYTDRLCHHDHGLKTRYNWSLVEGRGRRAFVAPEDPRHPRHAVAASQRPPPAADNDPPRAA